MTEDVGYAISAMLLFMGLVLLSSIGIIRRTARGKTPYNRIFCDTQKI